MHFGECESIITDPLISLQENKCRMTFRNPSRSRVRKIQIDDCVIRTGPRCDWLLINCDSIEHYVELKGSNVKHAVEQVEVTIQTVGADAKQRKAFIVSTRCPAASPEVQKYQRHFKKKYGATLIIRTMVHHDDI